MQESQHLPTETEEQQQQQQQEAVVAAEMTVVASKSVRFAEQDVLNEWYYYEMDSTVLDEEIWFTMDEFASFRTARKSRAKAFRKRGYDVLLSRTFGYSRDRRQQHQQLQQQDNNWAEEDAVRRKLDALVQLDDEWNSRGLEGLLSHSHKRERTGMKRALIDTVLSQQLFLCYASTRMTSDQKWAILGATSRDLSYEATVFARRLAEADEVGLVAGENAMLAEAVVKEEAALIAAATQARNNQLSSSNHSSTSNAGRGQISDAALCRGTSSSPPQRPIFGLAA